MYWNLSVWSFVPTFRFGQSLWLVAGFRFGALSEAFGNEQTSHFIDEQTNLYRFPRWVNADHAI